jgi:transposase-like protein
MKNRTCPHCKFSETLVKAGRNRAGSQRFLCRACGRSCTPEPKHVGRKDSVRVMALQLYAAGMSLREAAQYAGVNHQTVANWVESASRLAKAAEASGDVAEALTTQVGTRRALVLQEKEWRQFSYYRRHK